MHCDTYNNKWRVIKLVFAVDVHASTDKFLTLPQIAVPTGNKKVIELLGGIQRIFVSKNAALDHETFLCERTLELELLEHHDAKSGCRSLLERECMMMSKCIQKSCVGDAAT